MSEETFIAGRYEILGAVGRGCVGEVYKAYDHQLERQVALKRIHIQGDVGGHDALQRLRQEAKLLAGLNHPNIVQVYDFVVDETGPFIVMELLEGVDLEQQVEDGAMLEEDFTQLARESLDAIASAHHSHLLHRDLKPSNIMLCPLHVGGFRTKLLDFGLAKTIMQPSVQTVGHDGTVWGSIFFMSPEQIDQKELDGRSDLYSLGCTFYFALTSTYPFQGDTMQDVMIAHLNHRYVPVDEYRPDVSEPVRDWVAGLMQKERDDRPASAQEAWRQLQQAAGLSGPAMLYSGTQSIPPISEQEAESSKPQPVSAPGKGMSGGLVFALTCLVLVATGGTAFFMFGLPGDEQQRTVVETSGSSPGERSLVSDPVRTSTEATFLEPKTTPNALPGDKPIEGSTINYLSNKEEKGESTTSLQSVSQADPAPQTEKSPLASDALDPFDLDTIRGMLEQRITVQGSLVARIGQSRSGKTVYMNFGSELGKSAGLAFRVSSYSNESAESLKQQLGAFAEKRVQATGLAIEEGEYIVLLVDSLRDIHVVE